MSIENIGNPNPQELRLNNYAKNFLRETARWTKFISIVGFVMKLGPDAYQDKKKFPNGAYCKEGDLILMRSYSGTRFSIHGKEFRLINDDSVEATVQDPRGIRKV